jgi:hypothetical protein
MMEVSEGSPPKASPQAERDYLLKKLEETRKDCQWLLGVAAASVLGVVLKDNLGADMPRLRQLTLLCACSQIAVAMVGAMSWREPFVDKANEMAFLTGRLHVRYSLRNVAVALLAVSFVLIAILGWTVVSPSL